MPTASLTTGDSPPSAEQFLRCVLRSGLMPDFMPAALAPSWRWVERAVEVTPGLNIFAAHNVIVAQKP